MHLGQDRHNSKLERSIWTRAFALQGVFCDGFGFEPTSGPPGDLPACRRYDILDLCLNGPEEKLEDER